MAPRTLILRTAGTNCDRELAHAFRLAGAEPVIMHLNQLIARPGLLDTFEIIGFPGGFSYGDDIAAGRILANRLRHKLMEPLLSALDCGVPMIGICNGFQVLVKMGLLPEPTQRRQRLTLAENTAGRFIDRWTPLKAEARSPCIWTKGLERFDLPIAHGEGRLVADNPALLDELAERGQLPLRYLDNPNGSQADVAGVCDPTGLILGLMPHPERCVHPSHPPRWTRVGERGSPAGLRFFENAVAHVRANAADHAGA